MSGLPPHGGQLQPTYVIHAGEVDGPQQHAEFPQVCSFYMRTGTCAYGTRCKFYHPHPSEVPPPVLNSRGYPVRTQGEPDCAHFLKKGWCAFGMTCKFNHPELLSGPPNMAMATAQPGSMLVTTAGGSTTLLQGPVVYTTGPPGPAYQTMLQASPAVQPATTVYYVPTASGFVPSMVQPYTVQDGNMRGQPASTSIMVTQAPSEGQHLYTTAPSTSARTLYAAPGGGQMYSGAQFMEPQLLGTSGMQLGGGQPARQAGMGSGVAITRGAGPVSGLPGQGQLMSAAAAAAQQQQLQGRGMRQSGTAGGDAGTPRTITYLQDEPVPGQQLPTSYIQGLSAPMQQIQGGSYLQQAPQAGGMRPRQHVLSGEQPTNQPFGRHVMLSGARAGDGSGNVLQMAEGVYDQASAPGAGLMLYMDNATGRYAHAPSVSSSNLPSGSIHSGSFPTLLGPGGPAGPGNQSSAPTQDMASHERLAQAMKSLRLQKHKLEQYEQQPQ